MDLLLTIIGRPVNSSKKELTNTGSKYICQLAHLLITIIFARGVIARIFQPKAARKSLVLKGFTIQPVHCNYWLVAPLCVACFLVYSNLESDQLYFIYPLRTIKQLVVICQCLG